MIIDDYAAIAENLKRLQERENRLVKSKQELEDEEDALRIGNDEASVYPDCYEGYIGYII